MLEIVCTERVFEILHTVSPLHTWPATVWRGLARRIVGFGKLWRQKSVGKGVSGAVRQGHNLAPLKGQFAQVTKKLTKKNISVVK